MSNRSMNVRIPSREDRVKDLQGKGRFRFLLEKPKDKQLKAGIVRAINEER